MKLTHWSLLAITVPITLGLAILFQVTIYPTSHNVACEHLKDISASGYDSCNNTAHVAADNPSYAVLFLGNLLPQVYLFKARHGNAKPESKETSS